MKDVIVVNEKDFEEKKKRISEDGADKLHILTDFDRTLTKAYVNGKKIPSIISRLRDGGYISSDYSSKATALADHYHPIEVDPKISLETKKNEMKKWWEKHFDLLIESGLNKKHIEKIVDEGIIQFREHSKEFLKLLNENKIPLVIISSGGLGYDSINIFLEKNNVMYDNIHIISNSFKWDRNGNAVGINKPIIHVFNKDEQSLKKYPVYNFIKNRKNIILLGDSLGDLGMVANLKYKNLLKIGFLNENADDNIFEFKKAYDVILIGDQDMNYVNQLVKEIIK